MDNIRPQINRLQTQGEIILTGNFNAKLQVIKGNKTQELSKNGRALQEVIDNTNINPTSLEKGTGTWTRVNRNNPNERSVIDYVLATKQISEEIHDMNIDEQGIYRLSNNSENKKDTDHNTITFSTKLEIKNKTQRITTRKKGDKQGWEKYNQLIQEELKDKNIITYDEYHKTTIKALNEGLGTKPITLGKPRNHETEEIKQLREEKKKMKKTHQTTLKTKQNELETRKKYINSQIELRKAIEEHEKNQTKQNLQKLINEGGIKSQ